MAQVELSAAELSALIDTLVERAQEMDDDGREGAFDASPLKPIYVKLVQARRGAK
jgi:hypothetical protein